MLYCTNIMSYTILYIALLQHTNYTILATPAARLARQLRQPAPQAQPDAGRGPRPTAVGAAAVGLSGRS